MRYDILNPFLLLFLDVDARREESFVLRLGPPYQRLRGDADGVSLPDGAVTTPLAKLVPNGGERGDVDLSSFHPSQALLKCSVDAFQEAVLGVGDALRQDILCDLKCKLVFSAVI